MAGRYDIHSVSDARPLGCANLYVIQIMTPLDRAQGRKIQVPPAGTPEPQNGWEPGQKVSAMFLWKTDQLFCDPLSSLMMFVGLVLLFRACVNL